MDYKARGTHPSNKTATVTQLIRSFKDIDRLGSRVSETVVANWLQDLLDGKGGKFVVSISCHSVEPMPVKKKR